MPKDQKRVQLTRLHNATLRAQIHAKGPEGEQSTKYKRARADQERATRALKALGVDDAQANARQADGGTRS